MAAVVLAAGLLLAHGLPPMQESCWGPLPPQGSATTSGGGSSGGTSTTRRRPNLVVACANASDCTADIQAALDDATGRTLLFSGTYITTPLLLRANNTLLHFAPGSRLLAKSGAFIGGADTLLTVQGAMWGQACNATCFCSLANNITISGAGATFQMRRTEYTLPPYRPTENRMGLEVQGVAALTIQGLTIQEAGGDGIYIGQVRNYNVTISNVTVTKSYRNALTVVNVVGLRVLDTTLSLTNGTAPMAGVDFESDRCYSLMQDILFRNVSAVNNSGWGIGFTLGPDPTCKPWGGETSITARFEDIAIDGGGSYGFKLSANGPFPPGGHLHINGAEI